MFLIDRNGRSFVLKRLALLSLVFSFAVWAQAPPAAATVSPAAPRATPAAPAAVPPSDPAAAQRASIERMKAAIDSQMQAVRKQIGDQAADSGPFLYRASVMQPPVPNNCPAAPVADVDSIITRAATSEGLQPELIRAVIEQESGFQPCAVSPRGAMGMMQLMPATAEQFGVKDPFDPAQNIAAGSRFLKQLLTRYSDLALALAAYNSGPGRVDDVQAVPEIQETKNYVDAILKRLGRTATPAPKPPAQP
jgi:soluble lytic murein transglycosylase-like protein